MHCYNALWKITHFEKCYQSALNFGPSQRTLNIFFQNTLIWGILTHFDKKNPWKYFLHCWLYFSCLKISNIIIYFENASISSNVLLTILSIVRSFVMGLKKYCWDKSGLGSCKLKQFLQTRYCQGFIRIIGNSFLHLPDSWIILKSYWTHRCLTSGHPSPQILSIRSVGTYVIF